MQIPQSDILSTNHLGRIFYEYQTDATALAQKPGITSANMCRIEQGNHSPGLDIPCRTASVLGKHLDFVKKGEIK